MLSSQLGVFVKLICLNFGSGKLVSLLGLLLCLIPSCFRFGGLIILSNWLRYRLVIYWVKFRRFLLTSLNDILVKEMSKGCSHLNGFLPSNVLVRGQFCYGSLRFTSFVANWSVLSG